MKIYTKIFTNILFLILFLITAVYSQDPAPGENEYRLAAVGKVNNTSPDTITSDAGRGVWVAENPDLDNDGKPEIIVTEYTKGGRVFVFEVVGDNKIEYVWSSKRLSLTAGGPGSTPRSVTTGDFDNNGKQEIIFPVGHAPTDSMRGIYFYEWTGIDDDYGSEPTFRLMFDSIDVNFETTIAGRNESGLRCLDIDGDGRSELIYPPTSAGGILNIGNLYILQVTSGELADGSAVIENEYVYTDMAEALPHATLPLLNDGYVPAGTVIGDVDKDGKDEIIIAGWQNKGAGAAIGFLEITDVDTYTPGSIVRIADYSAFVVKATPLFATINDEPVIYLHGTNSGTSESEMWIMEGIISDQFVSDANLSPLFPNVGYWSAWGLGDQDHPTDSQGDGLDLYLYGGGARILDIEYDGTGVVTDTSSYSIKRIYDLNAIYDTLGGLFNDFFVYPGMDLDKDGRRDFVASYKGSADDSLGGNSLANYGFHAFLFEWGDSLTSIDLDSTFTGIEAQKLTLITPDDYQLGQNYPNPFNPTTNIEFFLPVNKKISLKIYDMLGKEIHTLAEQKAFSAGKHTVQWDGTNNLGKPVASGVYLYKLFYGSFSLAKKMTLIR